ncbi:glycosyltransferase family 4 protein [candidate division KSB1 bacterium]|nr:glycosyltransferase family 4 protein [candidate division KSB1 bacterium]
MSIRRHKIRVGTNMGVDYCQKRNIILPHRQFVIHREWDIMAIMNRVYSRLNKEPHPRYNWLHNDLGLSRSRLFHLYNGVSSSSKPWITTVESSFTELQSRAFDPFEYLSRDTCKAMLHISQWSYDLQLRQLNPDMKDLIIPKMRVLHPPQALLTEGPICNDFGREAVRFILVGNAFFRKGGYETLIGLERLREEGYTFTLDIVGEMFYGKLNRRAFGDERPENVKTIVARNPRYYTLHGMLSNEKTLALIRQCDVGLLPSLMERYGFVVLEYMALGLPVVTTNQRVFPEVNHSSRGWLAQLLTEQQEIKWRTVKEKRTTSALLEEELYRVFRTILKCPEQISDKSRQAIQYIAKNHNPDVFMKDIAELYFQALNDD